MTSVLQTYGRRASLACGAFRSEGKSAHLCSGSPRAGSPTLSWLLLSAVQFLFHINRIHVLRAWRMARERPHLRRGITPWWTQGCGKKNKIQRIDRERIGHSPYVDVKKKEGFVSGNVGREMQDQRSATCTKHRIHVYVLEWWFRNGNIMFVGLKRKRQWCKPFDSGVTVIQYGDVKRTSVYHPLTSDPHRRREHIW